jgi:PAS domain S-box-containing protein
MPNPNNDLPTRDSVPKRGEANASVGPPVPEVWVARMLRALGAVIVMSAALALVADLPARSRWELYALGPDAVALAIGSVAFLCASWASSRRWRPIVFGAYSLIVLNYWISAAASGDLESLLYSMVLFEAGTGALTPWESSWQAAFNAFCLIAWSIAAVVFPHDSRPMANMWVVVITGAGIGQISVYIRDQFAKDNLAGRQKLSDSETRLRKILDASPDAVLIIRDSDLVVKEILGGGRASLAAGLIGPELSDRYFYGTGSRFVEAVSAVREKNEIRDFEMDLRASDGTKVPFLVSAARIEIDGELNIVSFARDISELRRVQAQAEESEHRAQAILSALQGLVGISVLIRGRFVEFYGSVSLIGFTRDEIIGRTVEELGLWADAAEHQEFLTRMKRDGRVTAMEVQSRSKDGKITPILLSGFPIEINGEAGLITVAVDISEARESRRRLAESQAALSKVEAQFRSIVEHAFDAVVVVDAAGRISVWNSGTESMFGWSSAEAIGQLVSSLVVPKSLREAHLSGVARFFRTGEGSILNRVVERVVVHRDGHEFPVELAVSQIGSDGSNGFSVFVRDITKRRAAEQELIDAREAALAASQAKSEFLSSMSHEIRTPMNAILGMGELLSDSELDPEQRRFLDVMNANGVALLELINSVLDLAKIESGRMQIERTEFDLNELVEKTIATFGIRAHSKGLELAARIAPGTPENLVGDPLRLRQVLVNLLGNAIKFTEVGEVVLLVENDPASTQPGWLRFSVTDTGIGIAPEKLDAIFFSFTQADSSTTRQYGGSGLGLAIAQRLVTLMGGRIWVESEMSRGSNFLFSARFGLASKPISAAPDGHPDLTGYRVLIVDDNSTNRLIAREMIAILGAEAIEAGSGPEALELVRAAEESGCPLDMILLDMRMPGMDGLEIAERVRHELHATEPLILMFSSDDLGPQLSRMRKAGLDAYLVKPITRGELFEAIGRVLAQAKSGRGARQVEKIAPLITDVIEMRATSILVAEDSPDNRLLISAYLRRSHCTVEFALNGQEAFEMFTRRRYDLVLMDLQMPVMDGYASTRAIRQWEREHHAPRTSIVALTASAMSEDVLRVREAGCDAHVSKPFQKATLLRIIREYAHTTHAAAA